MRKVYVLGEELGQRRALLHPPSMLMLVVWQKQDDAFPQTFEGSHLALMYHGTNVHCHRHAPALFKRRARRHGALHPHRISWLHACITTWLPHRNRRLGAACEQQRRTNKAPHALAGCAQASCMRAPTSLRSARQW